LKKLTEDDALRYQSCGYFDEHLVTFYSLAYGEPYIYEDSFLVYHNALNKTLWISLFGLNGNGDNNEDRIECVQTSLDTFKPREFATTSPEKLQLSTHDYRCERIFFDRDYQIDLHKFDENLRGGSYKSLRYRVNDARRRGYTIAIGKEVTPTHSYIISTHMAKRSYNLWDYQLYLKAEEYIKKFSSPRLFNAFLDGILIGFDVVDFLDNIMATPLGFYLDYPSLADFVMYEEILYAKKQGFDWLDIGWACSPGLEEFKKKWMGIPKLDVWVQEFYRNKS